MSEIETLNTPGVIATAKTVEEAAAPLTEYEVQCVVSQIGMVRVLAAKPEEALEKAARTKGVIWPIAYRKAENGQPQQSPIVVNG